MDDHIRLFKIYPSSSMLTKSSVPNVGMGAVCSIDDLDEDGATSMRELAASGRKPLRFASDDTYTFLLAIEIFPHL